MTDIEREPGQRLQADDLNPQQQRTLTYVAGIAGCVIHIRADETDVVLELHDDYADEQGVYPFLAMDGRGYVAEYTTNHPVYFRSFSELKAATARS